MRTVMSVLSSSKSLIVVTALAIVGLFNFISSFRVPASRIDFLLFAASHLWPELVLTATLVLFAVLRQPLIGAGKRVICFLKRGDSRTNGLAFRIAACVVGVVLIYTHEHVTGMENDARAVVNARRESYALIFGDGYILSLQADAIRHLNSGHPGRALRLLERAQNWELASDGARNSISEMKEGVAYRIELARSLMERFGDLSKPATDYASTAYLLGAFTLNRDGYRFKEYLVKRSAAVASFEAMFLPILQTCGSGDGPRVHAKATSACVQLGAQYLDLRTASCSSTAKMICKAHGVSQMDHELASWILGSNTGSPSLRRMLNEANEDLTTP